jgi:hypothetical protein
MPVVCAIKEYDAFLLQVAFHKFDRGHAGKTSSYNLRPLLWEAGGTASNKVLECLVLRFAKNKVLTSECFVMAMVRLHLAHGAYRTGNFADYRKLQERGGTRILYSE